METTNDKKYHRRDYAKYSMSERGSEQKYPSWKEGAPNLQTFLDAINQSQPIVNSQFEVVFSRWPRTIFFAKGITVPGISVNTIDLSHSGFDIQIPTHPKYDSTELTMTIIADKEGFHYYDLRNMVLQTGHPLVAGDPRATIGNTYNLSPTEDTIDVRLRNKPEDTTHHHWIIHNFHPIGIGDIELSTDGSGFVEFELKGTFTHISYDCGKGAEESQQANNPSQQQSQTASSSNGQQPSEDNTAQQQEAEQMMQGDEGIDNTDDDNWENQDEWKNDDQRWKDQEAVSNDSSDEQDDGAKASLDDDDERSAYEILQNGSGKTDDELKSELMDNLSQKYPDEDPELIETRAEISLSNAKKYAAQNPSEKNMVRDVGDYEKQKPCLVLCKNMCGWIGEQLGEASNLLARAVRFNHKIADTKCKVYIDNAKQELDEYSLKTTQLTLPRRFGMYKTPENVSKTTTIELEEPEVQPDSSSHDNPDENHKFRPIFPIEN